MRDRGLLESSSGLEVVASLFRDLGKRIIIPTAILLATYFILTEGNSCPKQREWKYYDPPLEIKYQDYC
ncbi:hypothetical protein FJZ17_00450 [Candidatus Pacearchaeota archaeon]|nr:hypothetical protein [Candidatus Pacearchaeota archaeon]